MASRIFYTTHLLLILEWSMGRFLTEDLGKATDVPLAAQERVFAHDGAKRDMVSMSMFKVYEKYSKEPQRQSDGNTVRSFKAVPSEWSQSAWKYERTGGDAIYRICFHSK